MIAFLVDQNFNQDIVDGMTRRDVTLKFTFPSEENNKHIPHSSNSSTAPLNDSTTSKGIHSWPSDSSPDS